MFGHGPSVPPTPPPPPMLKQPDVDAAGMQQMHRINGMKGMGSTIKTGPEGLPPAATANKTLLGS